MRTSALFLLSTFSILSSCQNIADTKKQHSKHSQNEISFYTSDEIKIYGDLYELDKEGPIILLFHQGGSNAVAEYGPIIPQLTKMGFNILAIDQRMGGQIYGHYNRTLAGIPSHSFDNPYSYCDAYNNLESALDFVIRSGFTGNKIVWGSSYSASLVIQLADRNAEEIDGVLAFSPASGNSMKECLASPYFESLKVPLLLLRPPSEMESESVKAQFDLALQHGHRAFEAEYGVHGSSMLVEERVGHDVAENWREVISFLEELR